MRSTPIGRSNAERSPYPGAVTDPAAGIAFYCEGLGLKLRRRTRELRLHDLVNGLQHPLAVLDGRDVRRPRLHTVTRDASGAATVPPSARGTGHLGGPDPRTDARGMNCGGGGAVQCVHHRAPLGGTFSVVFGVAMIAYTTL